ncbi:hypothetical protein J25TS5_37210 [Paenibacillus faecis]|uniref:hypothetical protein n=1 Tax=Paenibacillus faecis TaxID=862114 RepID=UPI001B20C90B|nr:hypothetical protein [Paenibacillus faecis]GIO86789.1 hypothetical protein J25TS5_37210 [Paenibacillus faecis]
MKQPFFESSFPSAQRELLDLLIGKKIKNLIRYSWWCKEDSATECEINKKDVFSLTTGPLCIEFEPNISIGFSSNVKVSSIVLWAETIDGEESNELGWWVAQKNFGCKTLLSFRIFYEDKGCIDHIEREQELVWSGKTMEEYIIKYKNNLGEFINEECVDKNQRYIKEYYSKENALIKTELIRNEEVKVVRYKNCGENFEELLEKHLKEYGNISADFMGTHEITKEGYKVRGHLYEDGELSFVREIYYDMMGDEIKEVTLDSKNNYEPTVIEYYEYDENKELIGLTQKTIDGKVIAHIDFES